MEVKIDAGKKTDLTPNIATKQSNICQNNRKAAVRCDSFFT